MFERVVPLTWLHSGVIGAATADVGNTGVDDCTSGGSFNYPSSTTYTIEIDNGDSHSPNTFKWSNDGGATWEAEEITIVAGQTYTLEYGLTVSFAAADGHDAGDKWTVTCTGEVVSATASALSSTVLINPGCEYLTFDINYAKGTEAGLLIYIVKFHSTSLTSSSFRSTRLMDAGDGSLLPFYAQIKMTESKVFTTPPIDMRGIKYFNVYQIRSGTDAVSGTFTLAYEMQSARVR